MISHRYASTLTTLLTLLIPITSLLAISVGCSPEAYPNHDIDANGNNTANTTAPASNNTSATNTEAQCQDNGAPAFDASMCESLVRPRKQPVEFVGLTISQMITEDDFDTFIDGLYGQSVRDGGGHEDYKVQEGILLSASPDPQSSEQVIIELSMETDDKDNDAPRRTIFRAPASHAYGELFRDTVAVALRRAKEAYAQDPTESEPLWLEHRLRSVQGGWLDIRVRHQDGINYLELQTYTPRTSLSSGKVNQPAFSGEAYETIAGEVNFHLTLDQFDFFSTRAYGITAGKNQNFNDFELNPHRWLRLTVEPNLEDELVEVGFEVVTLDGRRLAIAKAPASILAGDQFRENVIRMHKNMEAQMERDGTSAAFSVPYYYDAPDGGGVVQVIARGKDGEFSIAYGVESPVNFLADTSFIEYQGKVDIPDSLEEPVMTCEDLGSVEAIEGIFEVTFDASSTVRNSTKLEGELEGNVWGSVFRAQDVTGLGPKEGAQAVASFAFEDVDLRDPENLQSYTIETKLPVGEYQLLGFIDIDANADPEDADPDPGDPVTLPIGGYEIDCAVQPIVVEFGILRP